MIKELMELKEVYETTDIKEVNKLMVEGWVLIAVGNILTSPPHFFARKQGEYQKEILYSLGRR